MHKFCLRLVLPALLLALAPAMKAQDSLYIEKSLPLKAQVEAAQAAIDACAAQNVPLHVIYADRYGNVRMMIVSDGSNYKTVSSARRKAYTAAMTGVPTIEFMKKLAEDPKAPVPPDPNMLFFGGGYPVKLSTGEIIGALGGGGGLPEQDAACVQVGVEKIQRYLK